MVDNNHAQYLPLRVYPYAWALALGWTLVVAISFAWNAHNQRQNTLETARIEARAAFEKDQAYRSWNRSQGGLYAQVSETVRPSPYLSHVPERDLITPAGRKLTLLNSSYMTRLVHDQAQQRYGIKGHVTSLRPVRPQNKPDEWEALALRAFERGVKEVSETVQVGGEAHMRLMLPLFADQTCMKCHAAYGTQMGEVRGGIRVDVPLVPLYAAERELLVAAAAGHGVFWLLGLAAIGAGSRRLSAQMALRLEAERREQERNAQFDHLTYHDALTQLPNRLLFQDRLDQALRKAHGGGRQMALLFVDLDRFKNINDTLGHEVGDRVLVETAQRLALTIREGDTVARLGGDEFGLLLDEIRDAVTASIVANKILNQMNLPFTVDGHELYCGCSVGIALYPADGGDVENLLKHADIAMYLAKESGRACYQFYSPEMNTRTERRLALENNLRHAVARDEMVVYYQPQVEIASGEIVGVEALLRWRHPEFGLVSPVEFIPITEADGSIVGIGDWVLRTACLQAVRWREGGREITMAVNLSARQFWQRDLPQKVARVLEETGLPPGNLELEVTESVVMNDAEAAKTALRTLARIGVRLSIDDFGTGYSSLAYLKNFPIHQLKVDRSFVTDITVDRSDEVIVSAIIGLACNLGLQVVAEGVETVEQLDWLRQQGCHIAQGFYFAQPVPAEELRLDSRGAPVLGSINIT